MTRYQAIFKKVVPRASWACAGLLVLGMAVPRQAHAQFRAELGIILAGLKGISSLLTSSVASPLSQIQKIEQQEQQYQQQVMYPLQAINSAKSLATSFTAPMQSMKSLLNLNISSATLPMPQQLEQRMLVETRTASAASLACIRRCTVRCRRKLQRRQTFGQ